MRYILTVHHIPGKKNIIPHTMSRRSDSPIVNTPSKLPADWTTQANVPLGYADHLSLPSWVSPPTKAALTNSAEDLLKGYTAAWMAWMKSTIDCWNGYHSVPVHLAERKLTTFITTWGRYRYRTSPKGLLSMGFCTFNPAKFQFAYLEVRVRPIIGLADIPDTDNR
jgi:hypothetical protein